MEKEHTDDTVAGSIKLEEVDQGILGGLTFRYLEHGTVVMTYNRSSEGAVQPTPTLADELWSRLWYIGLSLARLHVGEGPAIFSLGDEFETQNTVLSYG